MANRVYKVYEELYLQQAELCEGNAVAGVRAAFGDFSHRHLQILRSLLMPRQPSPNVNSNDNVSASSQQQLIRTQEEIESARDSAQRQLATILANVFGTLASFPLPSSTDVSNQPSVSGTFNQSNAEQDAANDNANDSDDDSESIKSENDSECESDCESDVEIKKETIEEVQNEFATTSCTAGNSNADSTNDNVSVKNESESECESCDSDSSSDDEEFASGQIKDENDNADAIDQLMDDSEEQVNIVSQEENTANEQVDNSSDNRDEERDESQAMDLNGIEEPQSDAETIIDEAFAQAASHEPVQSVSIPTLDFVSLPSTSTGRRRSTRSKKKVNYVNTTIDDSFAKKRVNSFRKNKSVRVESESSESSDEEEFVGQPNTAKRKVTSSGANTKKAKHSHQVKLKVIIKSLNCPQSGCNTVCKDKTSLNVHLLVKHAIDRYRCVVVNCTASFKHQIQLIDHRLEHGNPSDWPCSKCSSSFPSYSQLQNHHYKLHQKGLFECSVDDCDFKWINRRKVYKHQDCHRTPKHLCSVDNCGRSFVLKYELDRHLRWHRQERPFACDQCDLAFTQKGNLSRHLRSHSGTMTTRCTWPGCTYQAIISSDVVKHVRGVHFKLPPSKTKQLQLGIVDDRDAHQYLEKI